MPKNESVLPKALDAQRIARTAGGPILYYFLGAKQSYLWAITSQRTSLFQLPPASEIEAAVRRYRKALETPKEPTESQNSDGLALYQMLVAPAQPMLGKAAKVFIIPDGSLNALNFEALLAPDPKPHLLDRRRHSRQCQFPPAAGTRSRTSTSRAQITSFCSWESSVAPIRNSRPLAKAGDSRWRTWQTLSRRSEARLARGGSHPGCVSRRQARDSSPISILSRTAPRTAPTRSTPPLCSPAQQPPTTTLQALRAGHHSFTSARRTCHHLLLLRRCRSRAYSAEGLVGLSWAFLRAGAHT